MPGDSGGNNEYNIRVDAKDSSLTSSFDVTVTVTSVDEPPVITGRTTFDNWQENDAGDIWTYTAVDPEGDANITWSLGGTDRGDFIITDGVLAFVSTPDHELPADSGGDNRYRLAVRATDSNNKRGEKHVDLIVKNVDEPPALTGPDTVDDFPSELQHQPTGGQVYRLRPGTSPGKVVAHFWRHRCIYPSQRRRADIQQPTQLPDAEQVPGDCERGGRNAHRCYRDHQASDRQH